MSETKEAGGGTNRSQLAPWRWPLSVASLGALAWFAYEVLGSPDGAMRKQSFGLLLVLGTITALAWVMGGDARR